MAPSLANKKFDLSGIRSLKKNAGPGPGRPRTTPIDPNWHDLKAIESHIYSTIPADHDFDKLEQLIADVRGARADGSTSDYVDALKALLEFHYNSFDSSNAYTAPLDLVKADRFMSPLEVARVAGILHNKNRSGSSPKTFDQVRDELAKEIRSIIPRISFSALGGDWKAEGALEIIDRYQAEFEAAYKDLNVHSAEATFRAKAKAIAKAKKMISSPATAHIRLYSDADKADILVHMDTDAPSGPLYTPAASEEELVAILGGIRKARTNRFNKDKITIHALGNGAELPKALASQIGENDAAFTAHPAADGSVFLYPKKITAIANDVSFNPDWYSTDVKSLNSAYEHIIVHETGHLMMYKHWGSDKDSGRSSLVADMKKFKVSGGASQYGDQSPSENFAEQYAKYLLTGDASPEFLALLESKGLTKAQINKKWRDNYKTESHKKFFSFLDLIWADDDAQNIPEYNGPESSQYSKGGKYGSGRVHKLARFFGFTSNKPETVDHIPNDKYKIFRAVSAIKRDGNQVSANQLHDEFRTLDMPWYGYGIYGDGQYASTKESTTYTFGNTAIAMSVKSDAKVYVYSSSGTGNLFDPNSANNGFNIERFHSELYRDLLREVVLNEVSPDATEVEIRAEISRLAHKMGLNGSVEYDLTILAAIFGFQGIEVVNPNGDRRESYIVVLDRGMLKMVPAGSK